ncbi:hypothetical protein J7K55_04805 [Candidatus Aerophobetes bacterium]|nr:hypothetical protein [Candidatus Aerophobetes bacterium]
MIVGEAVTLVTVESQLLDSPIHLIYDQDVIFITFKRNKCQKTGSMKLKIR